MALLVGELYGLLRLDDSDFRRGINNAERSFTGLGSSAARVGAAIATAMAAAGAAVATAVGKIGIEFNAMMEQSEIAWETLLGSAEEAKQTIDDLLRLGAQTPFEFEGLDKAAKLLHMAKFEGEELEKALVAVGDAVSAVGGGQDELEGVAMALFQMQAKGKASAEEMNQLAERGIPAWEILAQTMGKSPQELMKMSEQGKLFANEVIPALVEGMGERFGGAMDKQSKTFNGLMSTLRDNFNMLMGEVMEPLFNRMKEWLPTIIDFVNDLSDAFENSGWEGVMREILPSDVANAIIEGFQWITETVTEVKQVFMESAQASSGAMQELQAKLGPTLQRLGSIINSFVDLVLTLWREWGDDILSVVTIVWNTLVDIVQGALDILSGILDVFIGVFTGDWSRAWEGLKTIWKGVWNAIISALEGSVQVIGTVIGGLLDSIGKWFMGLVGDAKGWGADLIRGFAKGISDLGGWIKNELLGFCERIGKTIKEFFGIASPSKLMAQYGQYIAEGLALGIEQNQGRPISAADNMANAINGALGKLQEGLSLTAQIAEAEFNLLAAKMQESGDESELLKAKYDMLTQQMEVQNEKVALLQKAYEDMKLAKGATAEETQKLYLELLKEQEAQVKLSQSIQQTADAYKAAAAAKQSYARIGGGGSGWSSPGWMEGGDHPDAPDWLFPDTGGTTTPGEKPQDTKNKYKDKEGAYRTPVDDPIRRLPGLATGGTTITSGHVLVGEEGPEILKLPKAASVVPLHKRHLMDDQGGGNMIIENVTLSVNASEIKDVADLIRLFKGLKQTARAMGVT